MKLKKRLLTLGLSLVMATASCIVVSAASRNVPLTDKTTAYYESSYSDYSAYASTSISSNDTYTVTRVSVSATVYAIDSHGAIYEYDSASDSDDTIAEVSFSSGSDEITYISSSHYSYVELLGGFGYSDSDNLP